MLEQKTDGDGGLGLEEEGQVGVAKGTGVVVRLGHKRTGSRSISQESLRGHGGGEMHGIEMDMVTTVVVEDKNHVEHGLREYSTSVNSLEKEGRRSR
jgi:hypothetical protein